MPGKKTGRHEEKRLSAAFVRSVKEPGRYMDGHGLFLVVDRSGAKRWGQRLLVGGERRDYGLGSVSLVTLAEAREEAQRRRKIARAGGDPGAERAAERAVPTFNEAVDAYLDVKLAEFRGEKDRKQLRSTLTRYVSPFIGTKRVSEIEVQDVLQVLEPIWAEKHETATRLRARMESIIAWATVKGFRKGDNPARWIGNLKELLPRASAVSTSEHHPTLAQADLSRWWRDLSAREGIAARALKFACLTAARSGEVRGMTWGEVDMEARVWTVPAGRMKAGKEHRVPISDDAFALLEGLMETETPRGDALVFPAPRGGPLSDMSISAVMRRMQASELDRLAALDKEKGIEPTDEARGYIDPRTKRPAVPHGLRSAFRDWVAEHTTYPGDMAEVALAHKVANAVEAAYRRGDQLEKRRQMMADWARVLRGVCGRQSAVVVPLRG